MPVKYIKAIACLLLMQGSFTIATAQKFAEPKTNQPDWVRDYTPFRIAGNLYYVGTYDLACYLITTPAGHILINTGLNQSYNSIRRHVQALGFAFTDIKILLATHAHFDHVGAMARIKKATGATLMIEEQDAPVLADGGATDYALGGHGAMFAPVTASRLLHNADTIALGGTTITLLHHPGHTKGASSFMFTVADSAHSYRVLIANMPSVLSETRLHGMPLYPNVGADYAHTLNAMKQLKFDIWLSSHASQCNLHQKHTEGSAYNPGAFRDQAGYDAALAELQKDYDDKLKGEVVHGP